MICRKPRKPFQPELPLDTLEGYRDHLKRVNRLLVIEVKRLACLRARLSYNNHVTKMTQALPGAGIARAWPIGRSAANASAETNLCHGRITVLQLGAPEAKPLGKEQTDELAVGIKVTPPQASRFLNQAVEPLLPKLLEHSWRFLQEAGVIIEGGADGQHGHRELIAHLVGKDLLPWATESDKENLRS